MLNEVFERNNRRHDSPFLPGTVMWTNNKRTALNWTEYLCEALLLGLFMLAACIFATLLEHPAAMAHEVLPEPWMRRLVMGVAMGGTAVILIHSPWGKRSGAHFNPAVTLTYWTLGRVAAIDALFYIAFQFAGGLAGVFVARTMIGSALDHPSVNYVATLPGADGPLVAFVAEGLISFGLMSVVLRMANSRGWSRFTPFAVGAMVASFILFEAPISGVSMNPARTFSSAIPARESLWPGIYFVAPPLGMLMAALVFHLERGAARVYCAKLHHHNRYSCIFRCNYGAINER
ncbi:MAG: aquaporin [Bryobacterales bacterium]|nr:aquaporin [Bryobacterales bacterium]